MKFLLQAYEGTVRKSGKFFIWNYFVVENFQENNFRSLPIPMKIL